MSNHGHPVFDFIYLSLAGILGYIHYLPFIQNLDAALSTVCHITSLIMFLGYMILHYDRIRLQLIAWFEKNIKK